MAEGYGNKFFTPKYIIGYLIAAVVVYGFIYYVFFANKGGYNSSQNQGSYNQPNQYATTPAASDSKMPATGGSASGGKKDQASGSAMMEKSQTITLVAQNSSGESGTATLEEKNGKVMVTVTVKGAPADVVQPAHIHMGSCATLGDVKYPLTSLKNGTSTTTLDLTMDQLLKGLPLAINVHKSTPEVKVYVSCGDIKAK